MVVSLRWGLCGGPLSWQQLQVGDRASSRDISRHPQCHRTAQDCPPRDKTPLSRPHYDWYLVPSLVAGSRELECSSHSSPTWSILPSDSPSLSDLQPNLTGRLAASGYGLACPDKPGRREEDLHQPGCHRQI